MRLPPVSNELFNTPIPILFIQYYSFQFPDTDENHEFYLVDIWIYFQTSYLNNSLQIYKIKLY